MRSTDRGASFSIAAMQSPSTSAQLAPEREVFGRSFQSCRSSRLAMVFTGYGRYRSCRTFGRERLSSRAFQGRTFQENLDMADPTGPSPLAFWLEEALNSWILPLIALAVVGAAALLFFAGLISEQTTGAMVVVAAPFAVAFFMLRPVTEPGRSPLARGMVVAAAVLTLVFTAWPALSTVAPGEPLFQGDVGQEGEAVPVPAGIAGRVRLLVSGALRQGGEPSVSFAFAGTAEPVEGRLERTYSTARVGRSGRARVAH